MKDDQYSYYKIAFAALLVGFSSLIYEIVATKALSYFFSENTYSTATVISIFLLGLAIGSFLFSWIQHKIRQQEIFFLIANWAVALYAVIIMPRYDLIPSFLNIINKNYNESFETLLFAKFVVSALYLIIPTIFLGMLLPFLLTLGATHAKDIGNRISKIYGFDLIGAITGALLSGFILIPSFGLRATIFCSVVINIFTGTLLFKNKKEILYVNILAASLVFSSYLIMDPLNTNLHVKRDSQSILSLSNPHVSSWNEASLKDQSSVSNNTNSISQKLSVSEPLTPDIKPSISTTTEAAFCADPNGLNQLIPPINEYKAPINLIFKTLFFENSAFGEIRVFEKKECLLGEDQNACVNNPNRYSFKALFIQGRVQCSTYKFETNEVSEIHFADYAINLFDTSDIKAVNIGLGCGLTLSTIVDNPKILHADIIEINPSVIKASKYFNDFTNNVLDNQKVNLTIADGFTYISNTTKKYNLVVVDIENPSIVHSSPLYTLDFFEKVANILDKDKGIFTLWAYTPDPKSGYDYLTIIYHTLNKIFPYVSLKRSGFHNDFYFYSSFKPINATALDLNQQDLQTLDYIKNQTNIELNTLDKQILQKQWLKDLVIGGCS